MHLDRNPFSPGAGTPPPELAGREDLLNEAAAVVVRARNGRSSRGMILVGLRGVGKTVLLRRIEELAEGSGAYPVMIEAHEGKSLPELLAPELREILISLSRVAQAQELARRGLRVLKGFVAALQVEIEGVTYGLSVDAEEGTADSGDLEADLPKLIGVVAEAARAAGQPVVLLLDEMQYLSEREFSALIMGLHRVSQRQLPFVLIGAGLPQILAIAGNSKSYAERLFRYPFIGALTPEEARTAIVEPIREEGATIEDEAVEELLEKTQRYPYFLQQWGYEIWNCSTEPTIRATDVEEASARAVEELDGSFFKVRFERCTPSEKRYMRALATLGAGPHRSGEVAEAMGIKVTSQGPVRSSLIRKGMIYSPQHGDIAFTVPLFEEYMLRAMPELN